MSSYTDQTKVSGAISALLTSQNYSGIGEQYCNVNTTTDYHRSVVGAKGRERLHSDTNPGADKVARNLTRLFQTAYIIEDVTAKGDFSVIATLSGKCTKDIPAKADCAAQTAQYACQAFLTFSFNEDMSTMTHLEITETITRNV